MKAVTFCNNTPFGKICLNSDVKIRRADGLKDNGAFVEYEKDNPKDVSKIEDLRNFWRYDALFIDDIADGFKAHSLDNNIHIYGLEDEYENTIALAKVVSGYDTYEGENVATISHIQAAPDKMYTSKSRQYKGIGETLVSQIVQEAKKKGIDIIKVTSLNEAFWENSKLFQRKSGNPHISEKYLTSDNFDKYINYVEDKAMPKFSVWI